MNINGGSLIDGGKHTSWSGADVFCGGVERDGFEAVGVVRTYGAQNDE